MSAQASLAERLSDLSADERARLLAGLGPVDLALIEADWRFWARPEQLPPIGDWRVWLVLAGRGFGKTRMGAEWIRHKARDPRARLALSGASYAEARAVMVEGPSGLLTISPEEERPAFEPSKHMLLWPNGAIGHLYSAEQPDALRGPQHSAAWVDELAKCHRAQEFWDMLWMGLRLGSAPQVMVTTTPRPMALLKTMAADGETVVTTGSTWANARNLAPGFIDHMRRQYSGTRLGRQELEGVLMEAPDGALWSVDMIDAARVTKAPEALDRIVVAVDPPVTSGPDADACGIIVAARGLNGDAYILDDASVERASPATWAAAALAALERYGGDRLVAEVNQGGDLVETILRAQAPHVPYRAVRASRGKWLRAEPVAALYEQGRVHHVGHFPLLEAELTGFTPGLANSPDRLDALVWALTDLMLGRDPQPSIRSL